VTATEEEDSVEQQNAADEDQLFDDTPELESLEEGFNDPHVRLLYSNPIDSPNPIIEMIRDTEDGWTESVRPSARYLRPHLPEWEIRAMSISEIVAVRNPTTATSRIRRSPLSPTRRYVGCVCALLGQALVHTMPPADRFAIRRGATHDMVVWFAQHLVRFIAGASMRNEEHFRRVISGMSFCSCCRPLNLSAYNRMLVSEHVSTRVFRKAINFHCYVEENVSHADLRCGRYREPISRYFDDSKVFENLACEGSHGVLPLPILLRATRLDMVLSGDDDPWLVFCDTMEEDCC
jgi:hypothetical protein